MLVILDLNKDEKTVYKIIENSNLTMSYPSEKDIQDKTGNRIDIIPIIAKLLEQKLIGKIYIDFKYFYYLMTHDSINNMIAKLTQKSPKNDISEETISVLKKNKEQVQDTFYKYPEEIKDVINKFKPFLEKNTLKFIQNVSHESLLSSKNSFFKKDTVCIIDYHIEKNITKGIIKLKHKHIDYFFSETILSNSFNVLKRNYFSKKKDEDELIRFLYEGLDKKINFITTDYKKPSQDSFFNKEIKIKKKKDISSNVHLSSQLEITTEEYDKLHASEKKIFSSLFPIMNPSFFKKVMKPFYNFINKKTTNPHEIDHTIIELIYLFRLIHDEEKKKIVYSNIKSLIKLYLIENPLILKLFNKIEIKNEQINDDHQTPSSVHSENQTPSSVHSENHPPPKKNHTDTTTEIPIPLKQNKDETIDNTPNYESQTIDEIYPSEIPQENPSVDEEHTHSNIEFNHHNHKK